MQVHRTAKALRSWWCIGPLVCLAACVADTSPKEPFISGIDASVAGDRSTVSLDAPVGGDFEAGMRAEAKPAVDAASVDAMKRDTAKPDAEIEAGTPSDPLRCNLLMQDCPNEQGCYPLGAGGSKCQPLDNTGGVPQTPCTANAQCLPGSFCGGVLRDIQVCVELCDSQRRCADVNGCVPIYGYTSVGYCRP